MFSIELLCVCLICEHVFCFANSTCSNSRFTLRLTLTPSLAPTKVGARSVFANWVRVCFASL